MTTLLAAPTTQISGFAGSGSAAPPAYRLVERARVEEFHPVLGSVCGHREYVMCSPSRLAEVFRADPTLAQLAWAAVGDRLVASRYVPLVTVTPDNVDEYADGFLSALRATA